MLKRINPTLLVILVVVVGSSSVLALGRLSFMSTGSQVSFLNLLIDTDRDTDGLMGPVRRVRTEIAKLSNKGGKSVEGPRTALETAAYDIKGNKTENAYFPQGGTSGTVTGKEVYKTDDKGNITEMTLQDASGTLLSKEIYAYEFDSFGNWTKMTTSVAVIEGGKINFEPTEVMYRTITYYLDEATLAKMSQPATPQPAVSQPTAPKTIQVSAPLPSATTPGSLAVPSVANNAVANKSGSVATDSSAPPPSAPAAMVKTSAATPNNTASNTTAPNTTAKADTKADTKADDKTDAEAAPKPIIRAPVKPISGGVLNGKATSLPIPIYPAAARSTRASGMVTVEVVIDGSGKVISAKAISGHPLLQQAAVQAAQQARFTPTLLSGQPVKISGIINYNFAMQ